MPTSLTPDAIAARMQPVLERWLGEPVDVAALLRDPVEAREVLYVCLASGHPPLVRLAYLWTEAQQQARQQRRAMARAMEHLAVAPDAAEARPAPQEAAWARNTSGFGVSAPIALEPLPHEIAAAERWLARTWRVVRETAGR